MTSKMISMRSQFTCDVCGAAVVSEGAYPAGWAPMRLPAKLVPAIAAQAGHTLSDEGRGTLVDVDACSTCTHDILQSLERRRYQVQHAQQLAGERRGGG